MCSVELRGRFCEPPGEPFGPRYVPKTRFLTFPSQNHRSWIPKLACGGHLCSPAPGPRKASLDQVPHYFRPQKPQLAGPQGRRIREACGHMRRPWKRDGPSTFPARRNASSPKNCERTSRVRMCARLPRVFGLFHFLGPIQIFQSENLFASLFNPKTSLPGQLGRRRTDFRPKMISRMTPKALPELPRCAP